MDGVVEVSPEPQLDALRPAVMMMATSHHYFRRLVDRLSGRLEALGMRSMNELPSDRGGRLGVVGLVVWLRRSIDRI